MACVGVGIAVERKSRAPAVAVSASGFALFPREDVWHRWERGTTHGQHRSKRRLWFLRDRRRSPTYVVPRWVVYMHVWKPFFTSVSCGDLLERLRRC